MRSLSSPVLSPPLPSLPCLPPSPVSALFLSLQLDLSHAHVCTCPCVRYKHMRHASDTHFSVFLCFQSRASDIHAYAFVCVFGHAMHVLFTVCAILSHACFLPPPRACLVWTCSCIVLSTSTFDYFLCCFPLATHAAVLCGLQAHLTCPLSGGERPSHGRG